MSITFCFVTKHQLVTNEEIKKVETEFKENSFIIMEQMRLGEDGVVFKVCNFRPMDFTYLEKALELDINFSTKAIAVKKLLLADMDSTIINSECIDELAEYAGVRSEVAIITEQAMSGEIDFIEALGRRVNLLRGLTIKQLTDCYEKKIHPSKGAKTLVKTMRSFGASSVIVSGGFSFFADKVASDVGFDRVYANHLVFEGKVLSGNVKQPILGCAEKQLILKKLCIEGNFGLDDVIAVGDGANDIEVIRNAGVGVSYYGKTQLTEEADLKIYHSNLRALLYFQGIKESDFVN